MRRLSRAEGRAGRTAPPAADRARRGVHPQRGMNAGDRPPIAERLSPLRRLTERLSRWLDTRTQFRHRIPIRGRIALFGAAVVAVTGVIFPLLVYPLGQRRLVAPPARHPT